jgi:hypothetical protein
LANPVVNYDGSIIANPQQLVVAKSVADIQAVLRDPSTYPGSVRAMGSYHSLTPCASSDGTIIDMKQMNQVLSIDAANLTFTAQAGLQMIDASHTLRAANLQFMLNIEIGNMTLGSAACCHSKDALDGIEFGQVSSYVIGMKWVTPKGDLAEASESDNLDLLKIMRSSYGLMGIVYEVTFRIKPIEALHFTYLPISVDKLTQEQLDDLLNTSEGLICWTVGRTAVFQQRHKITQPGIFAALQASIRHTLWNFQAAFVGHLIDTFVLNKDVRNAVEQGNFDVENLLYDTLHLAGGITLLAPDKTIDYRNTPQEARYAFTFWAFPRSQWLPTYLAYLDFADQYFRQTGFRCNMPLGAYHIRTDSSSLLSYTSDGEIFSIDPIHAPTDQTAWANFLKAFNGFASQRGGIPLLNQSPFITRAQVQKAYGARWQQFSDAVHSADPAGRLLNPFFGDLLMPSGS